MINKNQSASMIEQKQEKYLRQVTRMGVYGVILKQNHILLIEKKAGCYQGLLDLPGGGIEFGESPQEALKRELQEEVAIDATSIQLINSLSHLRDVLNVEDPFTFHHLGQIYHITSYSYLPHLIPEERFDWYSIRNLDLQNLTPFAQEVLKSLN